MGSNDFVDLLKEANMHKWCSNLFCTTCGCRDYRSALKQIGYEHILSEMRKLQMSDLKHISNYKEYVNVARYDLQSQLSLIPKDQWPQILLDVKAEVDEMINKRYRRRKEAEQTQDLIRIQKAETRNKEAAKHIESSNIRKKDRDVRMAEFKLLTIEEKLSVLARDPLFKADYYQLNLAEISDSVIRKLDSEIRNALIYKYSKYEKKEYRNFYKRLVDSLIINESD